MDKSEETQKKKPRAGLVVMIIGIMALIAGGAALAVRVLAKPSMRDAEFLIEVGEWTRADAEGVIWNFTEVGNGSLTTNSHVDDYNFNWELEGDRLKIETDWLYDLYNEYTYKLDQGARTLTLTSNEATWTFVSIDF